MFPIIPKREQPGQGLRRIAVTLAADLRRRYDDGMYESFDDPPQQQPRGYSAIQYLLGAAAGCVIASFVAVGVLIWLATTGIVRDDGWRNHLRDPRRGSNLGSRFRHPRSSEQSQALLTGISQARVAFFSRL